jgi:glutaredoxin-related protein
MEVYTMTRSSLNLFFIETAHSNIVQIIEDNDVKDPEVQNDLILSQQDIREVLEVLSDYDDSCSTLTQAIDWVGDRIVGPNGLVKGLRQESDLLNLNWN